jgi:hypothetical protein
VSEHVLQMGNGLFRESAYRGLFGSKRLTGGGA